MVVCMLRSESERMIVEIEAYHNEKRVNNQYQVKKRVKNGFCWAWPPSPSPLFEEAFEILSRGYHQCFTVHPPESPQAEPAMPCQSFQTGFINTAAQTTSLFARRTLRLEGTVIAVSRIG